MVNKAKKISLTEKFINLVRKHKAIVKFCLLFAVYIAIFFGLFILGTVYAQSAIIALNAFTARSVQLGANLLGWEASTQSTTLTVKGFPVEVIAECTGLLAFFVFLACILAYPTNLKKKLIGIFAGIIVIYILNIIRMLCLIAVGIWAYKHFDFVHTYLWEGVFIIVVLMLWLVWLDRVVKDVRTAKVSG